MSVVKLGNMEKETTSVINRVYDRFAEADKQQTKWTNLDTNMENLSYLDDYQLVIEAGTSVEKLCKLGEPRCKYDHKGGACFVPTIIEAVNAIIDTYEGDPYIDDKRRYVLQYFVSLAAIGEIYPSVV